jgi:ComF family protein
VSSRTTVMKMVGLKEIKDSFLHLLFPHVCSGCGSDMLDRHMSLCLRCLARLPYTHFEKYPHNPAERIFWGRLSLIAASAQYFFTKQSLVQRLMHRFKYRQDRDLCFELGRMMGDQLRISERFPADALVPLPLFPAREKKRGYNQAAVLCEGISESMRIPLISNAVIRPHHTDTQTKKGRVERWANIEGKFLITDPASIRNRHILLVDDVVTTGATLEACGQSILDVEGVSLSIATLCIATK